MIEAPAIRSGPPEHPVLDHAALVSEGMALLARMTDGRWTDFNAHDPGITLLELLCYALTDVGYRIFHDVPDLLSNGGADPGDGLWSAAEILTTAPVTLADMQRAVLDVDGVRNAWIVPAETPVPIRYDAGAGEIRLGAANGDDGGEAVPLKGLYRVLIEKSNLDLDDTALRSAVARRLHATRNLCDDFESVTVLGSQPVTVIADVEIGDADRGEDVLLAIYRALDAYISPAIAFRSLADMQARGLASEDIFDGPELAHGFLDPDLPIGRRRVALQVSDVVRLLSETPGVRAVRRVWMGSGDGQPVEGWSLPLRADAAPVFAAELSVITLHNRVSVEVPVDRGSVLARLEAARSGARAPRALARADRDLAAPRGIDRRVGAYVPLQNDLPPAYGLGSGALPSTASPARRAEVDQLRGFLALFDQILADELALLAEAPALLAGRGTDPAYPTGANPVLAVAPPLLPPGTSAEPAPDDASHESGWRRQSAMADHLLARFGEEVASGAAPSAAGLVGIKQALLRMLPEVGAARGTGIDYLAAASPDAAASGLERRIRLKLGLDEAAGESLLVIEHILLRPLPEDQTQLLPFLAAAASGDPFSYQVSVVMPKDRGRFADDTFRRLVERTVQEETPAHVIPYLRWLDRTAGPSGWAEIDAAYRQFVAARRAWWVESFGGVLP